MACLVLEILRARTTETEIVFWGSDRDLRRYSRHFQQGNSHRKPHRHNSVRGLLKNVKDPSIAYSLNTVFSTPPLNIRYNRV